MSHAEEVSGIEMVPGGVQEMAPLMLLKNSIRKSVDAGDGQGPQVSQFCSHHGEWEPLSQSAVSLASPPALEVDLCGTVQLLSIGGNSHDFSVWEILL